LDILVETSRISPTKRETGSAGSEPADILNWTGYVYGGLAHSTHIQYDEEAERKGEASVLRGIHRIGIDPAELAGRRVMDVGTGLYGLGFQRLGSVVEHHDVSTRTVAALRRYAASRGYSRLQSFCTDLVREPLTQEHFDLIYLCGVFQHFSQPSQAFTNLARALKVGGYLYMDIYRSGRWRWFVVDVLRQVVERAFLYDLLSRFVEFVALGRRHSFHLRQVELLVDDLFVENVHLFHPDDVVEDARELGLQIVRPVTSMDLPDSGDRVDHSCFFAHVFNTMIFQKVRSIDLTATPQRTKKGRPQLEELEGLPGSYGDVESLTAEFLLARRGGRFRRDEILSYVVNLFRMAHPCLPRDPYLASGRIAAGELQGSAIRDEETLRRRHSLWCSFLANILSLRNPLPAAQIESLGYELVRFLPAGALDGGP